MNKLNSKLIAAFDSEQLLAMSKAHTIIIACTARDLRNARKRSRELSKLLKQLKKEQAKMQARLLKIK